MRTTPLRRTVHGRPSAIQRSTVRLDTLVSSASSLEFRNSVTRLLGFHTVPAARQRRDIAPPAGWREWCADRLEWSSIRSGAGGQHPISVAAISAWLKAAIVEVVDEQAGWGEATMSDEKKPGKLNLLNVFEAASQRLLTAVDEGRILHGTLNIAGSGSPFEEAFRSFLEGRIPAPFIVDHGYLFDPESICTPQIDVIVSNSEAKSCMFKGQDGANYIPFNASCVIGEIKSSSRGITDHITQLSNRIASVSKMSGRSQIRHKEPLSFLLIGDAKKTDYKKIKAALAKSGMREPRYIILLNSAEIIAAGSSHFETDELHYAERGDTMFIWAPDPSIKAHRNGHTLQWLFHAIIYHLRDLNDGAGIAAQFSEQVLMRHPMKKVRKL